MSDDNAEPEDAAEDGALATNDDAANPQAIRKRLTRVQRAKIEREKFWKDVLATPVGRKEVWSLLTDGHCFEERFACGPNGFPQPDATWFHAGEQAFVLRLYQSLMLIDRAGVFLMHDEHDPRFAQPRNRRDKNG